MSWQIALCRFIHRSDADERIRERGDASQVTPAQPRTALMLAALTSALLGFEGRFGLWPPRRLEDLLAMYECGQQRLTAGQAGGPPARDEAMAEKAALIAQGLRLMDLAVQTRCGVGFETLSPTLRLYLLQALLNGEMSVPGAQARLFLETFVDVVTTAFLGSDDEAFGHLMAQSLASGQK